MSQALFVLSKEISQCRTQISLLDYLLSHPIVSLPFTKEFTSLVGSFTRRKSLADWMNLGMLYEDISDELIHLSCRYDKISAIYYRCCEDFKRIKEEKKEEEET